MGRVLLLIVLVVVGVWAIKRALARLGQDAPGKKAQPPGTAESAELVSCAHCGVLLPRAEALTEGQRLYCGSEHARRGPNGPPSPR